MKYSFVILLSIIIGNSSMVSYSSVVSDTTGFAKIKPVDSLIVAVYNKRNKNTDESFFNSFIKLDDEYLKTEEGKSKDEIYSSRISLIPSPIKLPYNSYVRKFIDMYRAPSFGMSRLLGRAIYFMPLIENELDAHNLPHEFKVIPLIESKLIPNAMSKTGTGGLWQMTYRTGQHYGLRNSSFIDERFDPVLSTRAVCRYLKILHNIYDDWTLVLAAYSCGSGTVNKLLKRYPDAKNYWDLYPHLPVQARNFIPSFIAMTYAYNFSLEDEIAIIKPQYPVIVDTVVISDKMLHLKQISSTIDVSMEILRSLNPMYKNDIVPATKDNMHLFLPSDKVGEFIEHEEEIYAKSSTYLSKYESDGDVKMAASNENGRDYITYSVKKGDILGLIAKKYSVKSADILRWNNIKDARTIQVGQKLKIYK